jgi:hypothetical protein
MIKETSEQLLSLQRYLLYDLEVSVAKCTLVHVIEVNCQGLSLGVIFNTETVCQYSVLAVSILVIVVPVTVGVCSCIVKKIKAVAALC